MKRPRTCCSKARGDMLRTKYDYIFKIKLLDFYRTQKINY